MLRFRPKLGSERSSEWRCFFCLHVRTGTILLGAWHILLHMIALGFLAAVVRDPNLLQELERESSPVADWGDVGAAMPTPQSNVDAPPSPYPQHISQPRDQSFIYHDVDMGALVTVCTLAITLMLIYGASRGRPAHLLPFFCLQIFDFAITVLTATGYLCYLRSIHRLVKETFRVPWRSELLQLPAPALAVIVLSVLLLAILIKGYCISVVWRCYKYLTMRTHSLHNLTPFVISSEGVVAGAPYVPPAPDYSSLLPDYEEAVKQTPPPSYRAATLMATANPAITTPETPPGEQPPPQLGAQSAAPAPPAGPSALPGPSAPGGAAAPAASAPAHTVVMLPQQGAPALV